MQQKDLAGSTSIDAVAIQATRSSVPNTAGSDHNGTPPSESKPSSASAKRTTANNNTQMEYIKSSAGSSRMAAKSGGIQFRTPSIQLEFLDDIDTDEILTKLSVRGWSLLPGTAEALYACLPSTMSLSTLSLWNCGLDDSSFSLISNCLLKCNIVNFQCDQNPVSEGLYAQLLSDLSPIKYLTLRSNLISDAGLDAISAALKYNRTLISLNLYQNNITERGMDSLADASFY